MEDWGWGFSFALGYTEKLSWCFQSHPPVFLSPISCLGAGAPRAPVTSGAEQAHSSSSGGVLTPAASGTCSGPALLRASKPPPSGHSDFARTAGRWHGLLSSLIKTQKKQTNKQKRPLYGSDPVLGGTPQPKARSLALPAGDPTFSNTTARSPRFRFRGLRFT